MSRRLGDASVGDGHVGIAVGNGVSASSFTITTDTPTVTIAVDGVSRQISLTATSSTTNDVTVTVDTTILAADEFDVSVSFPTITIDTDAITHVISGTAVTAGQPSLFAAFTERFIETLDTLFTENPNDAIDVEDDDVLETVYRAIARTLDDFDDQADFVQRDLAIATANGDALETRGEVVNEFRRTNEDDNAYRTRVQAAYGAAASDTTIEQFGSILLDVLQTTPNTIELETITDSPALRINVDGDVLDNTPFTNSEIIDLLDGSIPSGHQLAIETVGTFEFDGPNHTPSSNSGFGNGTFGIALQS